MPKSGSPRYQILSELGSGCFGVVYEAHDQEKNKRVAIKRIEKIGQEISREVEILQKLKESPNCIHMIDCFYTTCIKNKMIQNMVFDYYDKNLEILILKHKKNGTFFRQFQIKRFLFQLVNGLAQIHEKGIMHRDLKPENLLLNREHLVISDFGSSKLKKIHMVSTPYIVSRFYRAPELLLCLTDYDEKIDMWAVGCIFAEMCKREPIFQGKDDGDQLQAVFRIIGPIPNETLKIFISKGIPFSKKDLGCYRHIKETKRHLMDWVTFFTDKSEAFDLLSGLLEFDPEKRLSSKEALEHPFFDGIPRK